MLDEYIEEKAKEGEQKEPPQDGKQWWIWLIAVHRYIKDGNSWFITMKELCCDNFGMEMYINDDGKTKKEMTMNAEIVCFFS